MSGNEDGAGCIDSGEGAGGIAGAKGVESGGGVTGGDDVGEDDDLGGAESFSRFVSSGSEKGPTTEVI